MKLNNEDKRRLAEVLWMDGIPCYSEMSFDEKAEYQRYSVAATRKIRGTYNKIQKIAADYNIDRYDAIAFVKGEIHNCSALLLFLLLNFRNTQMRSADHARHIYEATGKCICTSDLKAMLFGLDVITQCNPISYTDTLGLDVLNVK